MNSGERGPAISAPLPWQGEVWSRWHQQLEQNMLPHALLITGPEDTGKRQLALALARLLLCQQPVAGHNCGECHACVLSGSGGHGDFRWLQPEEKSRVIKVDAVREIIAFGTKTASLGLRKVIVFAPAEALNISAANALLKSLEEPVANTYIILVSHRLRGLPATVRSRCQLVYLPLPPAQQSEQWLARAVGGEEPAKTLLALGNNRPLRAERYYREASADAVQAHGDALNALLEGRTCAPAVAAQLNALELDELLPQLRWQVQAKLRTMEPTRLNSRAGRCFFSILDETQKIEGALAAGANPNKALLVEALLGRIARELGAY